MHSSNTAGYHPEMDENRHRWFGHGVDFEVIYCLVGAVVILSPLVGIVCAGLIFLPFVFGPILAGLCIFVIVRYANRRHDPRRMKRPPDAP